MNFGERYGMLDRALYRIAFRAGTAQHALSDVEETLYSDQLKDIKAGNPVFITALPRSGTTILLKVLWRTGHFASHTYRDMPFVLCPLIWSRYSEHFAEELEPTERAHGDGLEVSGESPEAFEEMIWKYFWPEYYDEDRVQPWRSEDKNEEFNSFFRAHMRKIISVRGEESGNRPAQLRYLSKNNLNIARLAAPPEPLRAGTFVIPFRDPVQQAASMKRQHDRFLQIHEKDDFVQKYMEAIGHHEFGKGIKPVNFYGWLNEEPGSPKTLSFWLRYWAVTYRFVLEHMGESAVLLSYTHLTEETKTTLSRLSESLGLPEKDFIVQADEIHQPRTHSVEEQKVPSGIERDAREIYERLVEQAPV